MKDNFLGSTFDKSLGDFITKKNIRNIYIYIYIKLFFPAKNNILQRRRNYLYII